MDAQTMAMPAGGICLDDGQTLFLVDIGGLMRPTEKSQRRAFVDLSEAVAFIDGRTAKLSALLSPLGASSDAATFGLIEEVFESNVCDSYMVKFSNAPSLLVKVGGSVHERKFEPFRRVFPRAGEDL